MAFRTSPSSSSSLFSAPKWSYDVFLSFRREDTRNTFVAHLYYALIRQGIHTYIDEKDLERGETISPTVFKAIEESMISIIVLSSNYASSSWCLEELTQILECKETKQQIVLPVFYHVDPSEVRNQRGSFGDALAKHQERFKEDPKVQRWKEALQEVASLAGEHLDDGNEYEFMHKIIQRVDSQIVKSTYKLDIAEYPIGLESRLKDLNTCLGIGRNDITLMIGIYGIGGVGKTTIAKAVFNSIGNQFEARCFLENVREISCQVNGLVKLQERLLGTLLQTFGSFNIGCVGGTNNIKHRLCSKRILLILDDVNESHQLQGLVGDKNMFGPGSRIVITTRDQRLLTSGNQVDSTYEVQGLDDNQAIQLFSWHAFKRDRPVESYVELTKRIIDYAKGLPLVLVVLGSALYDRSIQEWESAFKKYERSPHKDIYEIFKISYDGLDDNEKDIFLDIACFFNGESVEYVMEILDNCHFSASLGIARLKDKSLISFDRYVVMHDLLQKMGKEIVRRESPGKPGQRSRLWFHEDVRHVLEENTGTNNIEGISLDFPGGHDEIRLRSKAFMNMKNLRLFINHNAQISGVPKYLSNELRMLRWSKYSSSSLPSNFNGNNLCIFRMRHSLIKKLDGLKLKNLREMDLSFSKFLTKIPDLSSSANLKKVHLQYCENLVEVHCSVGFLDKLSDFLVNGCSKLRIFPESFKLRSLCLLQLYDCSSLQDFPEILCEMKFLYHICLRGTSITELPSSIEKLTELQSFDLNGTGIKELPTSIGKLTKLERLSARDCKDLVHLPSSIHQLHRLCSLKLDRCSQAINIREVEEDGTQSTASVVCKGQYEIESSAELTSINSSIFNDGSSSSANWAPLALSLQFCCLSESNFFTDANYFPTLVELDLSGSDIVFFPQGVRFAGLKNLCLNNCKQLAEILPLPLSIAKVEARGCTSLKSFAELSKIFFNNNGRNSSGLKIDLHGCLKLLVNMMLPSWEERDSKEQNREDHLEARIMGIIFSGKGIPSWFSYRREADNSNSCEIDDINGPHYCDDIEEIILCVVIGFRIIKPGMEETEICVRIHDGWLWHVLCTQHITFDWTDSDHVWMGCSVMPHIEGDISRFRFECDSELVVFKSVGVHLVKKHEGNVRDHAGWLHEDAGAHFDASSEEVEKWVDLNDDYHLVKRHRT